MIEVKLETGNSEPDAFNLYDDGKKIGEMIFEVKGDIFTVFHTEVDEAQAGKGYATKLLNAMTEHVREKKYKVVPMCAYVNAQFRRNPDLYQDIWSKP